MKAPGYLADFDSATAMVRGVANVLEGRDQPQLGMASKTATYAIAPLAPVVNALPDAIREQIYIWSGRQEAIPPEQLDEVDSEEVAAWVASLYPREQYPAIVVGSSSGALVHFCAALGVPFIPQTFLVPVRRSGIHPDEPLEDLDWAQEHAPRLLDANPDLQLHHMHDANQDRLMIQRMTYFRVKRLRLGDALTQFIESKLAPDGALIVSDCTDRWPAKRVSERYVFQHGAEGGATPEEYLHGGERVAEYLERYDSPYEKWDSIDPDGEYPEAEWGFEPALLKDLDEIASRLGVPLRRLQFNDAEGLSPMVADLYRWWYEQRQMPANRLLVESFAVMEPTWTLRTGSVPFWLTFNKEPSAELLEGYLDEREPFDEIFMMLFSHGVESIGLVPIERWRAILERARVRGEFVGVDEDRYPRDFAVFNRYYRELQQRIHARYPLPAPLTLAQFEEFYEQHRGRYDETAFE